MKNRILSLCLMFLFMIISCITYSQTQEVQKNTIKPALLVIDIQNAYLSGMAQKDKDVAMLNINYYINLFRSKGIIRLSGYIITVNSLVRNRALNSLNSRHRS